jgi:hypothetical protein
MKYFFVISAAFILLAGCGALVNDSNTIRAVEAQGYSNIQINNKHVMFVDWCGCGNDDDAAYEMTATNPAGKQVNIIACAGISKGVTIRTK